MRDRKAEAEYGAAVFNHRDYVQRFPLKGNDDIVAFLQRKLLQSDYADRLEPQEREFIDRATWLDFVEALKRWRKGTPPTTLKELAIHHALDMLKYEQKIV